MKFSKRKGQKKKENDNGTRDKTILLVDSNSIAHMAKHSMKGLSFEEMSVGVIFGFMNQILSLGNRFNTKRFVFAWDSRKNLRKLSYKEYKQGRKTEFTKEDIAAFEQFTDLRQKILPQLGFKNVFIRTGYEGDDILAKIAKDYKDSFPIGVITYDRDLLQVLNGNNFIWHPMMKKKAKITAESFTEEKGISPWQWPIVKSLMGDTSDNISGIPGVGPVNAIRLVNGQGSPEMLKKMEEYESIVKRNLKLITLPYPGLEKIELDFDEKFFQADFVTVCKKYGFRTMFEHVKMSDWVQRFDMV